MKSVLSYACLAVFLGAAQSLPAHAIEPLYDVSEVDPAALNHFASQLAFTVSKGSFRVGLQSRGDLSTQIFRYSPMSGVESVILDLQYLDNISEYRLKVNGRGTVIINRPGNGVGGPAKIWDADGLRNLDLGSDTAWVNSISDNGLLLVSDFSGHRVIDPNSNSSTELPIGTEATLWAINDRGTIVGVSEARPSLIQLAKDDGGQYQSREIPFGEGLLGCYPSQIFSDDSFSGFCFTPPGAGTYGVNFTFRDGELELYSYGSTGRTPSGYRLFLSHEDGKLYLERKMNSSTSVQVQEVTALIPSDMELSLNSVQLDEQLALHGVLIERSLRSHPVVLTLRSSNFQGNVTNRDDPQACQVNVFDLQSVVSKFGKPIIDTRMDHHGDGTVDTLDLQRVLSRFGQRCSELAPLRAEQEHGSRARS